MTKKIYINNISESKNIENISYTLSILPEVEEMIFDIDNKILELKLNKNILDNKLIALLKEVLGNSAIIEIK